MSNVIIVCTLQMIMYGIHVTYSNECMVNVTRLSTSITMDRSKLRIRVLVARTGEA